MSEIISCKDLHKTYKLGASRLNVLRGAGLSVEQGEFVAIIGASGSGKSTLLHILGALDKPDEGNVLFRGEDITRAGAGKTDRYRNKSIGFVFQFYHLVEELNVLENILMPAMAGRSALGWLSVRRSFTQRARGLADRLGLTERLNHRPSQLSGGERQRVAIGRALINSPDILLADEPTGNLDWPTGSEILKILREFHAGGQTIILVTHDERIAAMADRTITIRDGEIV